ncbi:response regulator transcription factor [Paenibacillus sedimenti]|uniref:Response regulator transcription factor n=1 Tax=Paenibacillus sedimenti TaxID=2770274 RepID=A0A926KWD4_9BACL|nr:response regulator transcription factor [Paenibacillus sedimenti]MBD0384772.1 response regulator transcription factor [Paenibacillus sedimenti]
MWKIAIVDDDFQVLRGLRSIIPWDELDAECIGDAIDGEEGLELIRGNEPDIVITDLYMPGISGIEMIKQLRSEGYQGRFIILSGYTDFEYARQAIRLDVDDYLNKPGTVEHIREVLYRTIQWLEESFLEKMEKTELLHSLKSYENQLAHNDLISLLTRRTEASSELKLPGLGVLWQTTDQRVVLLELVKTERVTNISLADWHLFRFAMINVVEELLQLEWPKSHYVWLNSHHSAIVLHVDKDEPESETERRLVDFVERMTSSLQHYLKLTVKAGIGGSKRRLAELADSMDEAMQALDSTKGSDAVELVRLLTQSLQKTSQEELWDNIVQYINRMEASRIEGDTALFYKVLATELWTLLQYAVEGAGLQIQEQIEGALITQPDTIINRTDLETFLQSQIKRINSQKQPAVGHKHKMAVEFMLQYIHEHYPRDITLEELAGQLFISKNYLNQLFKKVTGESFMNYVIRVRLEKAKALLLEGNLLIYEVAEKVGYQNVPYFSTLFKKYCGVNPSDLLKK